MKKDNTWYQRTWLPFAAFAYIIICIFDFVIMPLYVTAHNSRIENEVFRSLEGKDAAAFADAMAKTNQATRQWNPITLLGAGMFHLSFGALLTGGAVTRGFAKKSEIEGYYRYGPAGYEESEDSQTPARKTSYNAEYDGTGNAPYVPNTPGGNNAAQNARTGQASSKDDPNGPMKRTEDLDTH